VQARALHNGDVLLFVCLSVRLSVCLSPKTRTQNAVFSKAKQFRADLYWRPIGSPTRAFQRTNSWTYRMTLSGDFKVTFVIIWLLKKLRHSYVVLCHQFIYGGGGLSCRPIGAIPCWGMGSSVIRYIGLLRFKISYSATMRAREKCSWAGSPPKVNQFFPVTFFYLFSNISLVLPFGTQFS